MKIILLFVGLFFSVTTYCQPSIIPFVKNGKIGYKNLSDSVVMPPVFDFIEEFKPGYGWTVVGTGKYTLLNNRVDRRRVKFTGIFGFISDNGDQIVLPAYDLVLDHQPGYAIVGKGEAFITFDNFPDDRSYTFEGRMGIIDDQGEIILPVEYTAIQKINHPGYDYWFARNEQGSFLFSGSHDLGIPKDIEDVFDYHGQHALFKCKGKFGYLDEEGRIPIEPEFDKAESFREGRALVKKDNRFYYIDPKSMLLEKDSVPFIRVDAFSEGYARVMIMDEFGYIDTASAFYLYPQFTEATPFFNNIAYVADEDRFGYVFTGRPPDLVTRYEKTPFSLQQLSDDLPESLKSFDSVACQSHDSTLFFRPVSALTVVELGRILLESLRWAPYRQKNFLHMIPGAIAGEGTLAARHEFTIECLMPGNDAWEVFKKKVIFRILEDPDLREATWTWFSPFLLKSFQSMPAIHQEEYMQMTSYLEAYYRGYDLTAARSFLAQHEAGFAYRHYDGTTSPYRKTSALIDRLILRHEVITPAEALEWIRRLRSLLNNPG